MRRLEVDSCCGLGAWAAPSRGVRLRDLEGDLDAEEVLWRLRGFGGGEGLREDEGARLRRGGESDRDWSEAVSDLRRVLRTGLLRYDLPPWSLGPCLDGDIDRCLRLGGVREREDDRFRRRGGDLEFDLDLTSGGDIDGEGRDLRSYRPRPRPFEGT